MIKLLKGVDLSYANQVTDYKALANAIDFAILRAGYGKNNQDKLFATHLSQLMYEVPLGFYWFSYATSSVMAANEAKYLCDLCDAIHYPKNLPLYWDFEYDSDDYHLKQTGKRVDVDTIVQYYSNFASVCYDRGYFSSYYANLDYIRRFYEPGEVDTLYRWKAYYVDDPHPDDDEIQQYTSTGKIPGVLGSVDLNVCNSSIIHNNIKQPFANINYSCIAQSDWVQYYNKWLYYNHDTETFKEGWVCDQNTGDWYYLDIDTKFMLSACVKEIGGEKFIFDESGRMLRTNVNGALK